MKCNECKYGERFYIESASLCGQDVNGKLYERSVPARSGYICSNVENVHYLHLVHKDHECEEEKMKKGPPSKALATGKGSRRGDHWRKTREKIAKNNKSRKA